MTTKLSKADHEEFQALLKKHQIKHPGCKLSERRCRFAITSECIGKGTDDQFHKTSHRCLKCKGASDKVYYDTIVKKAREKVRKQAKKDKENKKKE